MAACQTKQAVWATGELSGQEAPLYCLSQPRAAKCQELGCVHGGQWGKKRHVTLPLRPSQNKPTLALDRPRLILSRQGTI